MDHHSDRSYNIAEFCFLSHLRIARVEKEQQAITQIENFELNNNTDRRVFRLVIVGARREEN